MKLNPHLQTILELVQSKAQLSPSDQHAVFTAAHEVDKLLSVAEFKTSRFDKEKRTVSVLLEETIDELQQKSVVLEQANLDLTQALNNLQTTQNRLILSEKMAALGELTAGIAHEIQNPLNFVNNFSKISIELVEELKEDLNQQARSDRSYVEELLSDLAQNLEKIALHGKRADSIVKGMLQHSRTNTGQRESTDLNALADEFFRLSYHGLRAKDKSFNAELITDFDPAVGRMDVVAQDIGRVLLNLYNNALYAVQEKQKQTDSAYRPLVQVRTRRNDEQVEIRIIDNGTGIPESVRQKVFQPFFTTKPTGQGTGLGLSLSYDIVTQGHGGTLEVETEEGVGTAMVICLPL